jgi:hypothetical protein
VRFGRLIADPKLSSIAPRVTQANPDCRPICTGCLASRPLIVHHLSL